MRLHMTWLGAAVAVLAGAGCATSDDTTDPAPATQQAQSPVMTVSASIAHDVSAPLRDAMPLTARAEKNPEHPVRLIGLKGPAGDDPVVQAAPGTAVATANGLNFPGVGNGDYGFAPNAAPPDTNGVVGSTQYVQWVNESFAGAAPAGGPTRRCSPPRASPSTATISAPRRCSESTSSDFRAARTLPMPSSCLLA